jgi:hypothetical protein
MISNQARQKLLAGCTALLSWKKGRRMGGLHAPLPMKRFCGVFWILRQYNQNDDIITFSTFY